MKFKTLARKGCAVFLALALCMSLVQVPAFAAELEGGETPSVSEPAAPEANETTSPVDKAPADNGAAPAPEAPKQDVTEETTPVETPEEETNQETKEEPAETETPEADAEEGTAQEETNEETNSEEPNDEDATDNETPEEDAEAEDAEEETPEDAAEEDAAGSETPEEEAEEDADKEESTDEEEVLDEEPTEEVTYSEAAQKFLDAVAGLPDSVTKENFESISALLDKVQALFGALTEEEMALVDPVLVKVSNLMESLDKMEPLVEEEELSGEVKVETYEQFVAAVEAPAVTAITLVADIVGNFTINHSLALNLGGFTLGGLSDTGEKSSITVANVTTPLDLTINGGTISNIDICGFRVRVTDTLTMSEGATITGSNNGGVIVEKGATFNMNGGEISKNTLKETNSDEYLWGDVYEKFNAGGGIYVNGGTFNMNGGTITENNTGDFTSSSIRTSGGKSFDYLGRGGGVAVMNDGTFNLNGGTISNNEAAEGGGVFIGKNSKFFMNGNGTVDRNVAHSGEGGGIYIKGTGEIKSGNITNNETKTITDLGGGGIYVENNGTLHLENAIITKNEANSFGGGIAACVHGKTSVFSSSGAAIYGNQANGNVNPDAKDGENPGHTDNTKVDGFNDWKNEDYKDLAKNAMDIFSAGNKDSGDGNPGGALISLIMLGGGTANWAGWRMSNGATEIESVENPTGAVYSSNLLGLTASPDQKAINKAEGFGAVRIEGNKSAMHGGGIANNGILTIGATDSEETENAPELDLSKTLENVEDREGSTSLQEGEFSFNLKDDDGNIIEMKNTANGKWTYDFSAYSDKFNTAQNGTEFKFTVSEDQSNKVENIEYDLTTYEVIIKVSVDEISANVGGMTYNVITRLLTPTIMKVTDKNGDPVNEPVSVLEFVNTYTAPEKPEVPEVPEKPPVDPVDPPEKPPVDPPEKPEEKPEEKPPVEETPEEPPVDVPDEEPPLVDIPEEPPVDIPDEEPPLVEIPDEQPPLVEIPEPDVPRAPATPVVEVPDPEVPLVDIPEEDVPLADVPATGDNSGLWMVLGLVACAGLAYFFLDEKKRQNEAK